jgi:DNA-binding LacI/PurR family transcriptional regulator
MGPFQPDFTAAGQEAVEEIVRGGRRAVIAYNDQIAVGLMKGLARQGLRAGRDFSLIGFDDSWLTDMIDPPLTTVRMPFAAAGRTATQLLLDVLSGQSLGEDATVELTTRLIVRESSTSPPLDPAERPGARPGTPANHAGPGRPPTRSTRRRS